MKVVIKFRQGFCSIATNTSLEEDYAQQEIEENEKEGYNYKIENGYIIPLDDEGREYPCCEYEYDENGFDF